MLHKAKIIFHAFFWPSLLLLFFFFRRRFPRYSRRRRNRRRVARHTPVIISAGTTTDQSSTTSSSSHRLDPKVLATIPSFVYSRSSEGDEHVLECTICLGMFEDGECRKLICGHSFHAQCIDKWFKLDSTCPICRLAVEAAEELPL